MLLLLGSLLLYIGAEGLVRSSSSLATRLGISPLVAGLTVVGFGTSSPELCVSLSSALGENADIALGNVVGSNIFNIAVILGIASMIRPMAIHLSVIRRDIPVMISCSFIALFCILNGVITRPMGLGLIVLLIFYIFFTIRQAKRATAAENILVASPEPLLTKHWALDILVLLSGLSILILGSDLFVDGATVLAKSLGVSDAIIALTVVAAGTSLPELATSIVAALKKQSDIAIGNVVGSNIFNILGILGCTASVKPIQTTSLSTLDTSMMIGLSILVLPFAFTHLKITRIEGVVLIIIYLGYIFLLWPK